MKLYELYTTPDDIWDDVVGDAMMPHVASNVVKNLRTHKQHKYLGSGSYAYVGTNDDENFGDVHRIAGVDDGGSMYLKYLADHPNVAMNPFFPRVHKVAKNEDTQVTIIERLLPFRTEAVCQNELLMKAIWGRYFNISQQEAVKKYNCKSVAAAIPYIIQNALIEHYTGELKDKRLIEAMHILTKISGAIGNVDIDIHPGNIMWRMAPYQPQLVITDPFTY